MKWINVNERMPKESQQVLIFDSHGTHGSIYTMCCTSYLIACLSGVEFSESYRGTTHWMPLPKPPND